MNPRKTAMAVLALSLTSVTPAFAHGNHDVVASGAQIQSGICQFTAPEANMHRIEAMFRSMPEATRMNLQHVLRHAGLYAGSDDGIWGVNTSCAIEAVAARFDAVMTDQDLVQFFEYLLDGGFTAEYPGTPDNRPHRGVLY
ncbi:hypothetical protein [Pseudosulfitobacter pseudonitzschiae]|uniref:hypothetical protein n=1 Tax=Pseudosulfitobacter pseudonitzschiae TaxID=1402135 RepID=UPI003B7EB93B